MLNVVMLSVVVLCAVVLNVVVPYDNSSFGGFHKNKISVCPWQASLAFQVRG